MPGANGDLKIALELTATDLLSPEVNKAINTARRLQRQVQELNGAGAGVRGPSVAAQVDREAQQAAKQVGQLDGLLKRIGSTAAGTAIGMAVGPLIQGFAQIPARAIQLNSELEQARVTITAFTRDGQLAGEMLAALKQNADITPYTTEEVINAGRSLVPIADKNTQNLMHLLRTAEILAALHPEQGLEGAAFALREAQAGQYRSVMTRFDLGSPTEFNELRAQGLSGLDAVDAALKKIGADYSLITAMGKTGAGEWSTFTSVIDNFLQRATSPLWDQFGKQLDKLNAKFATPPDGVPTGQQKDLNDVADAWGYILGGLGKRLPQIGEAALALFPGGVGELAAIGSDPTFARFVLGIRRMRQREAEMMVADATSPWTWAGRGDPDADMQMRAAAGGLGHVGEDTIAGLQTSVVATRSLTAAQAEHVRRIDDYREALKQAGVDGGDLFTRHTAGFHDIGSAATDAAQKVGMFDAQLKQAQSNFGIAAAEVSALQQARTLMRRMGTYHGEYDATIVDDIRRQNREVLAGGAAAMQEHLARVYAEQHGLDFFNPDHLRVQTIHADQLVVNGQSGGATASEISGGGAQPPVSDMISRRYDNARAAWPWAPGVGGGR